MATGILRVKADKIVDENGSRVILREPTLGGWMNMENSITGFPYHESQHRARMRRILGPQKYEFFFDKWLEYFFTEKDAKFLASLGLNCLRLPFNYHIFEDDMNPRVLVESGFKHLDRVVNLCAKHGIYTILDMHFVPGGDNPTRYATFWDYKDNQDRTVWLWKQIAVRYKQNPWVAGYEPLNEPRDPEHVRLLAFYKRMEKAIRAIDPNHILWLDCNTSAVEWDSEGFQTVLPNCVYAMHDSPSMGFPAGDRYTGTPEQKQHLEQECHRKVQFMREQGTPVWNRGFRPVYANPAVEIDAATINQEQYELFREQLRIYDKHKINWSIRLYKDNGLQGMIYTDPESRLSETIQPFLKRKRDCWLDKRRRQPAPEFEAALKPLVDWIDRISPSAKYTYPTTRNTEIHVMRSVFNTTQAASFVDEFVTLFSDMDKAELEELARSFHFEECVQRKGLIRILKEHARLTR